MTALILLGPPGVGKGTQASFIASQLEIPAISTGHIFRSNMEAETELGKVARSYIDQGQFVPDSVTNPMVEARLSAPDVRGGFLLDGYPRTLDQAHVLRDIVAKNHLAIDLVVEIAAPHEVLVNRMKSRASTEHRSDDRIDVFERRLHEYNTRTEPIATYYAEQYLLETVDGSGTIDEVSEEIMQVLVARGLA